MKNIERPTPDGKLFIETIRQSASEPALRRFDFANIRSWRRDVHGITIIWPSQHTCIPWSNIAEYMVIYNSEEYKEKRKQYWEVEHVKHVTENTRDKDCPHCSKYAAVRDTLDIPPSLI